MYKAKRTTPLLIIFSFTLFACTQPAEDPTTVADRYWHDIQNGNTVEAEKLVSSNSRYTFSESKDRTATIKSVTNSDPLTTVRTTITTIDPDTQVTYTQSFDTVLVLEQGQWKVDVKHSQIPPVPVDEKLSDSMKESIETIDEALTQGMKMLNEALREGSEEMGDSLMNLMNELNDSMQQSIDKLKQRREQQEQEQQQKPAEPGSVI